MRWVLTNLMMFLRDRWSHGWSHRSPHLSAAPRGGRGRSWPGETAEWSVCSLTWSRLTKVNSLFPTEYSKLVFSVRGSVQEIELSSSVRCFWQTLQSTIQYIDHFEWPLSHQTSVLPPMTFLVASDVSEGLTTEVYSVHSSKYLRSIRGSKMKLAEHWSFEAEPLSNRI